MKTFEFSHAPLQPAALQASLADVAAGGYASFEGWVRNDNEGRAVKRLDYEAFEELALKEGERIVAEAVARFGVRGARCVHRLGELALGELAVWVGVASGHRAEAFAACRYVIDEVKQRVPIWKKEHYLDGDSGWVNCERCAAPPTLSQQTGNVHHHGAVPRYDYSRQMALKQVGAAGQRRLSASTVLVVGAGGLGCPVLSSLAGAGVGTLRIVDADVVEPSNLPRQPLYALSDSGQPKARVAAHRLAALNPEIRIEPLVARFDQANAAELVASADVVVDCSDNFTTKFLVNDACVRAGKPAVLASVHQYEGQLQVARPDQRGPCLRCVWPEATVDGLVGNCAVSGVLGPVPAVLGGMQAMETLKILLDLPGQLRDEVIVLDLLTHEQTRIRARRAPECGDSGCARLPALHSATVEPLQVAVPLRDASAAGYRIIDIREPDETASNPLCVAAALQWPLARLLADGPRDLDHRGRYLLVCARGVRSLAAAEWLRSRGIAGAFSLSGGVEGDPGR